MPETKKGPMSAADKERLRRFVQDKTGVDCTLAWVRLQAQPRARAVTWQALTFSCIAAIFDGTGIFPQVDAFVPFLARALILILIVVGAYFVTLEAQTRRLLQDAHIRQRLTQPEVTLYDRVNQNLDAATEGLIAPPGTPTRITEWLGRESPIIISRSIEPYVEDVSLRIRHLIHLIMLGSASTAPRDQFWSAVEEAYEEIRHRIYALSLFRRNIEVISEAVQGLTSEQRVSILQVLCEALPMVPSRIPTEQPHPPSIADLERVDEPSGPVVLLRDPKP